MNLAKAFALSAEKNSAKTAVYWGEAEFTYGQLLSQTRWLARQLTEKLSVKPGDRVGLLLRNCPEYFPALYGVLQAGATAVPINNFLKLPEVSYILADAGIDVLLTEPAFGEARTQLQAARPQLRFLSVGEIPLADIEPGASAEGDSIDESKLAVIIYTSGTTGRPKGAMLSHGNLLHNVESCRQVLAAVNHDQFVLLLPMFHSFMLCVCILLPTIVGGSIVLVKSLNQPKAIFQEIFQRKPTILPAIPPFFRMMIDSSVPADLPLRLCISGAAPLPVQLIKDFNRKFSISLIEGYGLSEASPVVAINPIHGPWKAGSIGMPVSGVEVSIQNDAGECLSTGEIGELCVRGGNVMQGYWNKPEDTAQVLRNGWLLTGDVGYCDSDGYIFITDRKKDMLLVNGINVYPREIEEIIYQFPGIKEAAVVGRPDPRRGEQPVAFVSLQEGMSIDVNELLKFLKERLADYKVPRHIRLLPLLPRNSTGKILKTTLRQLPIDD